ASELGANALDLARVDADADSQPDALDGLDQAHRESNGARRPIERQEESIARRIDLTATEAAEFSSDDRIEALEEVRPPPIPELRRTLRRVDDVDEHHGRKDAFRFLAVPHPGEKLLDLLDRPIVTDPPPFARAREG